jgi:hypothetical protein
VAKIADRTSSVRIAIERENPIALSYPQRIFKGLRFALLMVAARQSARVASKTITV